jgi:3-methyladenine DNA glycosylase AlkD
MTLIKQIQQSLESYSSKERAINLARFFKTGKGQYGEGDRFMGIVVPNIRKVATMYFKSATLDDIEELIKSPFHEVRLCALIMMVYQYQRAKIKEQRSKIYNLYLSNTRYINNWDLVDLTAPNIVGEHLMQSSNDKAQMTNQTQNFKKSIIRKKDILKNMDPVIQRDDRQITSSVSFRRTPESSSICPSKVLHDLAKSDLLWERRIAILATFTFIKVGSHSEAFAVSEILLHDTHDLIHKAVGWMLREVGKRVSIDILREFLDKHAKTMPRAALRYAIEHMDEKDRRTYLHMK